MERVINFYSNLFKDEEIHRPLLDGLVFDLIDPEDTQRPWDEVVLCLLNI